MFIYLENIEYKLDPICVWDITFNVNCT